MNGYVIIVEGDEATGFGAWSPDLLGCVAAASTDDECVQLMREAVALHLEVMREYGDPIPEPSAVAAFTVAA